MISTTPNTGDVKRTSAAANGSGSLPEMLPSDDKHLPNPSAQSRLRVGEERRRSQRVLLRVRAIIHVDLQGKEVHLDVMTLSVNTHGALVVMQKSLQIDTKVVLEHSGTQEKIACRVVRTPKEMPEGFHTALEFSAPAPDFWRIAFPPANWTPVD